MSRFLANQFNTRLPDSPITVFSGPDPGGLRVASVGRAAPAWAVSDLAARSDQADPAAVPEPPFQERPHRRRAMSGPPDSWPVRSAAEPPAAAGTASEPVRRSADSRPVAAGTY